jgi:hypothetical protein
MGLFVAFLGITCASRAGAAESIFVGNNGVPPFTIGEYTIAGATVNASLISGLGGPQGIAISGGDLFVTNGFGNTIGENTIAGATVNASLITGLNGAFWHCDLWL